MCKKFQPRVSLTIQFYYSNATQVHNLNVQVDQEHSCSCSRIASLVSQMPDERHL